jgi:glycosyltransferase involved in cell wall biosynthesis
MLETPPRKKVRAAAPEVISPPPALLHPEGVAPKKSTPPQPDYLRACAWQVAEHKPAEGYVPQNSHCALAIISPTQGFAHWRMLQDWIDKTAREKGGAWHHCRMVLRLYDVSYINFNGLNAHRIQDISIHHICGHCLFGLPRAGTFQLAEAGFLLRDGEFIAAARSHVVQFPPAGVSPRTDHAALLVDGKFRIETVSNLWEQENILSQRRKPRLRERQRIATFAFEAEACGHQGPQAKFATELAAGQARLGHDVHVFVPGNETFSAARSVNGVNYHPLDVPACDSPIERALAYARAAENHLRDMAGFNLFHLHEWMTGLAPWLGTRPTVLSLSSTESTRMNGNHPSALSQEISKIEGELLQVMDCVLTPEWLRSKLIGEFKLNESRVHAFPMEGRAPNEWETPLDTGQVKAGIGFGPLDRMALFVGPLTHAAGLDLLLEALPTLLHRAPNLRVAAIGCGPQQGRLQQRAHELRVAHALRLLGHRDGDALKPILRSAEALVLPSRSRVAQDDAVVHLARLAGKAVVTTHGGPAWLVRHEETGLITYDNPGSMVWALDRILGDVKNTERMGNNGRDHNGSHGSGSICQWSDVARFYLDLCASSFPELAQPLD